MLPIDTQDPTIGTAPPWMRKPQAMAAGGQPIGSTTQPTPQSTTAPIQTDPGTGPGMDSMGITNPAARAPGTPTASDSGSMWYAPPTAPGGPNDYPQQPQTDPATDPYAPVSSPGYGFGAGAGAFGANPGVQMATGVDPYTGTGGNTFSSSDILGVTSPSSYGAAVRGTGMPGGMSPTSGTTGIDINGQQAWNGGPSLDMTRVGSGGLPSISTDFSGDAQKGADAAYKGATQYMDQDFTRDNNALESKLVNQGFTPGSEAFTAEMEKQTRGQNAARQSAAYQAQGVGFNQSGELLQRALASRAALYGERSSDADRLFGQSLSAGQLGLGARAQDMGLQSANASAGGAAAAAGIAADAGRYSTDVNATLALRRLGIDETNSGYSNLINLINSARGGVNMPNFGTPTPLDVTGANSIASGNANAAAARTASNNGALAQLGGSLLGSYLK